MIDSPSKRALKAIIRGRCPHCPSDRMKVAEEIRVPGNFAFAISTGL
jgi:hypothetical protein